MWPLLAVVCAAQSVLDQPIAEKLPARVALAGALGGAFRTLSEILGVGLLACAASATIFAIVAMVLRADIERGAALRPMQDADPLARRAVSVGQILGLLGPLVACLLGFAGIAEDRERGTLRLALGNGARPRALLIGRGSALVTILLATLVAPAALLGGGAILTMPDAGWTAWIRLAIWCGIHAIYVATFLLVALAVSLRARTARASLATLAAVWVVACVVLPRVATNLADVWSPLPSYQDVRARAETEAPVYESYDQWEARRQSILATYGVTDDADAPVTVRGAQLDQAERHSHEVFDRLIGGFHDRVEAQDRLFGRLGVLSPAVALQTVSAAVAGTDFHQHRHFVNAAESYRRALVSRINGEVTRHDTATNERYEEGADFWANVAPLTYRPPAIAGVIAWVAIPLLALAAWCAAAAAAALAALRGLQP
jgi:ABC-2 type transport system permease protein